MEPTIKFPTLPEYKESIEIGGNTFINVTKRHNWFHRAMMKLCFGWKFKDL